MNGVQVKKRINPFNYIKATVTICLFFLGFYVAFLLQSNTIMNFETIEISFIKMIPFIAMLAAIYLYGCSVLYVFEHSLIKNIYSIMLSLLIVDMMAILTIGLNKNSQLFYGMFLLTYCIQFILLLGWELIVRKVQKHIYMDRKVLMLGDKKDTDAITEKISLSQKKYRVNSLHVCNKIDHDIFHLIDDMDEVFICSNLDNEIKAKIVHYCVGNDKVVFIVPKLFEISVFNSQMVQFDDIPVFKIDSLYLTLEKRMFKRGIDIVLGIAGIVISFPIMLIVGLLIFLYDKGPILFSQERITRGGEIFTLYKFRTMVIDAEKNTGPVFATENDIRITRIGKILRATRIDELPQLFNVLKGEMSIVGPRPERPDFVKVFNNSIPEYPYRMAFKAGITGLAQVYGKYSTAPEDKIRYDLLYIKNYSVLMDIKIIILTIKIMLMKERALGIKQDKMINKLSNADY